MGVVVTSTLSLLAATVTQAQGRREISLPDTLGARFSIADSATKSGTPADYDFLIGLWHFRFQTRGPMAPSTRGSLDTGPSRRSPADASSKIAGARTTLRHYGPAIVRIRYFAFEKDRFLWRADRSTDGGNTWLLDAWTMEATLIAR